MHGPRRPLLPVEPHTVAVAHHTALEPAARDAMSAPLRLVVRLHPPLLGPSVGRPASLVAAAQFLIGVPSDTCTRVDDLAKRIVAQFHLDEEAPHGIELCLHLPDAAIGVDVGGSYAILPGSETTTHVLTTLDVVHVFKREADSQRVDTAHAKKRKRAREMSETAEAALIADVDVVSASEPAVPTTTAPSASKKQRRKSQSLPGATSETAPATAESETSRVDVHSNTTAAGARNPPIIPSVPLSSPAPELLPPLGSVGASARSKKKKRRGKKKSKKNKSTNNEETNATDATPTKKANRRAVTSDSDSSSSSESSSDSDSDSDAGARPGRVKSTAPTSVHAAVPSPAVPAPAASASTPAESAAAAHTAAPLLRLPKGHFKFTEDDGVDDDATMTAKDTLVAVSVAPLAPSSSPSVAAAPSTSRLAPAPNAAPLFFITSKEHVPRAKQKQRHNQTQPRGYNRQVHTGNEHAAATSAETTTAGDQPTWSADTKAARGTPMTSEPLLSDADEEQKHPSISPAHPTMSAVPWEYDNDESMVSADSEDDLAEEQAAVSRALETFGEHFIAPRTLKRLGGATVPATDASHAVAGADAAPRGFEASPLIDLIKTTLSVGDLLAYRVTELTSWTPTLSAWRTCRVRAHAAGDVHGDRECEQDRSAVTISVGDIAEARLIEGPSFTACSLAWREEQRALKKANKWRQKHGAGTTATGTSATASTVAPKPASPATTTTTSSATRPVVPHTRASTRFTLMSNVVRALQQKAANAGSSAVSQLAADAPRERSKGGPSNDANSNQTTPAKQQQQSSSSSLPQPFVLPSAPFPLPSLPTPPPATPPPSSFTTRPPAVVVPASAPKVSRSSRPQSLRDQSRAWTTAQVCAYLTSSGLGQLVPRVKARWINGRTFVELQTADDVTRAFATNDADEVARVLRCVQLLRGDFTPTRAIDPPTTNAHTASAATASALTPAPALALTPPDNVAEPTMSELEQLLARKRQEIEARAREQTTN